MINLNSVMQNVTFNYSLSNVKFMKAVVFRIISWVLSNSKEIIEERKESIHSSHQHNNLPLKKIVLISPCNILYKSLKCQELNQVERVLWAVQERAKVSDKDSLFIRLLYSRWIIQTLIFTSNYPNSFFNTNGFMVKLLYQLQNNFHKK